MLFFKFQIVQAKALVKYFLVTGGKAKPKLSGWYHPPPLPALAIVKANDAFAWPLRTNFDRQHQIDGNHSG